MNQKMDKLVDPSCLSNVWQVEPKSSVTLFYLIKGQVPLSCGQSAWPASLQYKDSYL